MKIKVVSYHPYEKLEGQIKVDEFVLFCNDDPYSLDDVISYSIEEGWAYVRLIKKVLNITQAPLVLADNNLGPRDSWLTVYKSGKSGEIKIRRSNVEID